MRTIIIDGSSYKRITYPVFLMLKHHHKFCYVTKSGISYHLSGTNIERKGISEDYARASLMQHFRAMTAEIVFRLLEEQDAIEFIDLNA